MTTHVDEPQHDRIGRDDGTGNGPRIRVPRSQVAGIRALVAANRRALGLPPQDDDWPAGGAQ